MHSVRKVTDDLFWIGGNDHRLTLFENIHPIPKGVSYNAYVLLDEKTVLFDTADWDICRLFLENLEHVLAGRPLDYIVINHMEPDHAASLGEVLLRYPDAAIISTEKAFIMMRQFGVRDVDEHEQIVVTEGDSRCFGGHTVTFVMAPMVHWPEAMMTLDLTNGAFFTADAFGSFIALDGKLFADEVNFERDWLDEARRYYTNIVGKYGPQVQRVLGKAAAVLDKIKFICPLHGPVWRENIPWFIDKYDHWSRYEPEGGQGCFDCVCVDVRRYRDCGAGARRQNRRARHHRRHGLRRFGHTCLVSDQRVVQGVAHCFGVGDVQPQHLSRHAGLSGAYEASESSKPNLRHHGKRLVGDQVRRSDAGVHRGESEEVRGTGYARDDGVVSAWQQGE